MKREVQAMKHVTEEQASHSAKLDSTFKTKAVPCELEP